MKLSIKTRGISPSDLSAIENGRKIAHPGWRRRIAKALKVTEETLFGSERGESLKEKPYEGQT